MNKFSKNQLKITIKKVLKKGLNLGLIFKPKNGQKKTKKSLKKKSHFL